MLVFAITAFIFLVVEGVLVYCIFRFRRRAARRDRAAAGLRQQADRDRLDGRAGPDRVHPGPGHHPHAVGSRIDPSPAASRATSRCSSRSIGHQWWWEYVYEHYDGRDAGLHHGQRAAYAGQRRTASRGPVYLTLKSADVCHSFWVPRLAGKTDLIPGRTNHMWFRDRASRACFSASVPSTAAPSTPTCCCA